MNPQLGLLLADDLIFISRITGTAQSLGLEVRPCRTPDDLLFQADLVQPACVLIDLHHESLKIAEVVKDLKKRQTPFIVAYGSHVDAPTLKHARDAGCNLVLPRSKFVEDLPTDLPKWFAPVG